MSGDTTGRTRADSLRLPAEGDSETLFRQYVRLACHQCHRDGLLDRVLLVTDELIGNSIRHAGHSGEGYVELSLVPTQRGLHVEVRDGDPTPPRQRQIGPDDVEGRGLQVVDAIATAWGYEPAGDGKTVWADVDPE